MLRMVSTISEQHRYGKNCILLVFCTFNQMLSKICPVNVYVHFSIESIYYVSMSFIQNLILNFQIEQSIYIYRYIYDVIFNIQK